MEDKVVDEIVPSVLKLCAECIKKHLIYTFKFKSKILKVKEELDKLEGQQESLQHLVDEALRQGDKIESSVERWQSHSVLKVEKAQALVKEAEKLQSGKCCRNLKKQWRLGRRATKELQGIAELLDEKENLGPVSYCPAFRPIEKPPGFVPPSRTQTLDLVMQYLEDWERKKVGIYGMGGVGKTFMAGELVRKVKERNLFHKIAIVSVSHVPTINKLRIEIAGQLDLNLDEGAEAVNQSLLYHKLKEEKKVLIILDDLWKSLDLNKVGIPDEDELNDSKVLLISRRKDVLESMGSSSSNNISLELLPVEESMDLFKQKAGRIQSYELAEQIVRKCDGHPLSLVAMGCLVKNKQSEVWEDIVKQLFSIPGDRIQEKVLSVLELSYNYLGEEQKSVFLLCGLLDQAQISSLILLKYCWGLGLFRGIYRVVDAWNRLLTFIDDLVDTSLIISFSKDDALITIHDMVRDTAASIAMKNQNTFTLRNDSQLEKWPENSMITRICLPHSDVGKLPNKLDCPNLEFFLFQAEIFSDCPNLDDNVGIPREFFEITKSLRVVTLSKITTVLPKSLGALTNLRTLCLHDCILSDVTFIGRLENMEILSFRGSNLQCVPSELGQLKRLKVLDLHNCKFLTTFTESVLSNLSELEELYMGNTSVEWDSPGNARISELASLCHLTTLEIQFPIGNTLPKGVVCSNLKRFRIGFGRKINLDTEPSAVNTLLFPKDTVFPHDLKILLAKTESLTVSRVKSNALIDKEVDVLDNLRTLWIFGADDLLHIVCSKNSDLCVFPKLETLQLRNTTNLKSICFGPISTQSFSHLKTLSLFKCDSLKYVFSLSIAESLGRLETLEIEMSNKIEEIIYVDEDIVPNYSLTLPSLVNLDLWNLPRLRWFVHTRTSPSHSFIIEDNQIETFFGNKVLLPQLESLCLFQLPKVEMLWPDQLDSGSFAKLKHLKIVGCGTLQTVFQPAISNRFVELSKLEMRDCEILKEIYRFPDVKKAEENGIATLESKLAYISLKDMPKLQSIWGNEPSESLRFQYLETISITRCQSLKTVFPLSIVSQLRQLKVFHLQTMGFTEIFSLGECGSSAPNFLFPQLTSLKLEYLPNPWYEKHNWLQDSKSNSSASALPLEQLLNAMLLTNIDCCNLTELLTNGNFLQIVTKWPRLIPLVSKVRSLVLSVVKNSLKTSNLVEFSHLEKLHILDSETDNVFEKEMNNPGGCEGSSMHPLKSLKLENIASLNTLTIMEPFLGKLENLELLNCCDVMYISTAYFQNLLSLTIDRCDKMVAVLPYSIAITMEHLVKMTIRYCSSLKEVVCADEGQLVHTEAELCITFSKLKILVLETLPTLASFCSAKFMFKFPLLEEVTVIGCPTMEVFSHQTVSTPKLKNLVGTPWQCAADLNSTISKMYSEMIGFRYLGEINLSKSSNLIEKWHGELEFKLWPCIHKVVIDSCVSSQASIPLKHFNSQTSPWGLIIENCESIEEIFYLGGIEASLNRAVALLHSLKLNNLPNLRNTWNIAPVNILRFEFLKILEIENCDSLANVFTLPSATVLSNLWFLTVKNCASLSEILTRGADEETDWDGETLFPSLYFLTLTDLPSLKSFYANDCVFKMHSLTQICVINCPELSVFDSTGSNDAQELFNGQVDIGKRLEDIQIVVM